MAGRTVCIPEEWKNTDYDDGYAVTAPMNAFTNGDSQYGIYNMAGNVFEWVADWYGASYYALSPSENPSGPSTGTNRVVSGGSWASKGGDLMLTANRGSQPPDHSGDTVGFRCASDPPD